MAMRIYKLARKIHKWTSIGIGVVLLIWLISGIFHVIPLSVLERIDRWIMGGKQVQTVQTQSEPANVEFVPNEASYRNLAVSIPEAISILETDMGHAVQLAGCSICRLSDTLVYEITLEDGGRHLIDAIKGIPLRIAEAEIKESAIAAAPQGSNIVNMTFLTKRPYAYWGPIPTYRFAFDDVSRTYIYVSPITGQVEHRNKGSNRLRQWMLSLHKFEFLMLIWEREAFRKGTLLICSLVGLAVVITGFYIALPVKWLRSLGTEAK
jgi:uncharacterized iron-regulated membrane protein